jgi:hypothetical protein
MSENIVKGLNPRREMNPDSFRRRKESDFLIPPLLK